MSTDNVADVIESPYGYVPSRGVAITFVVLFSISTVAHVGQSIRHRLWWILPTVCLCGVMEIAGWAGRLWSSFSPLLLPPFQMQITLCILAPTPLIAANFIILGDIIKYLGPAYSRLSPRMYAILFCTCDVASLFIQGAGGGIASSANTPDGAKSGSNIMLVGIVFQLFVIIVYSFCGLEFFIRHARGTPLQASTRWKIWEKKSLHLLNSDRYVALPRDLKIMAAALLFNTTALFIRAIYRVVELADGWDGTVFTNERYFNVLDGAMVILAIYTFNFVHPGMSMKHTSDVAQDEVKLEHMYSA
ncbi:RTA1 like protein-domain-containing protein [Panaeolus papilionaceus]|nr:RTA1 like protein-domain-containing protein [Panaeolus papilionaceus]